MCRLRRDRLARFIPLYQSIVACCHRIFGLSGPCRKASGVENCIGLAGHVGVSVFLFYLVGLTALGHPLPSLFCRHPRP